MKFILVDGNSFCYRAFYAVRDLKNSKNEPTNAIYGFVSMFEKLLKDIKPDGVVVAFDLKGPTFRHKRYEEYKIQRQPMPEDLVFQIPLIKDVISAMNVPIFEKEGYEADDIIATLAKKIEKSGNETFIATADKDMLQLVNKKTKVLNPQKDNFIYDEAAVKERFGVEPGRVVEIMALMGDASDNIPGVSGIGEKTAMKLIAEFGTLDGVLKNISKIQGEKLKANLTQYEKEARLSRELATIDADVPIQVDIEDLKIKDPDIEKLTSLYKRFEFRSLLKNMGTLEEKNIHDESLKYTLIETKDKFEELKLKLSRHKEWAFDFETTDVNPLIAEPVGISFSFKEKEAYYVAFTKLKASQCLLELKDLFEDKGIRKIGQNIKYEILILKNFDIHLKGVYFDTMVASYCLNPAKPNHNLDDIAMEHLGIRITDIVELIGTGKNQITMKEVAIEKVFNYGCQDSDVTFRLSKVLHEKLKEKDLLKLFNEIEMPLVEVLAKMESAGVALDEKLLKVFSKEMASELDELTANIHKLSKQDFNINSTKQLQEILFEKLKLPVVKKTKTGASTDVEVLRELALIHPLPKEILRYRELSKLKSTYVDALGSLVNPKTHRIHTSFNQTVTATGRLSSSDPNLQNIPIRTEEGKKIRRAFIAASKDLELISADYSQIELRVLAHLSGDQSLIRAFKEGADIHRYTASLIFNTSMNEVTDSMRSTAKTVNFGVLYGMGPFSLAKSLHISNEAAKDFIKAYFERYPSVKGYLDRTIEKAREFGYVETFFHRRRYIPEILSKNNQVRSFAERTAINMPLQGTASDVIKIAMIRIQDLLEKKSFQARMILQVHDELLFEAPKSQTKDLIKLITKEMTGAVDFKVPMEVSVGVGANWLDMEEITSDKL